MSERAHTYLNVYKTLSEIPSRKIQKYLTKSKTLKEFNSKCQLSDNYCCQDAVCTFLEDNGFSFEHLATAARVVIRQDEELSKKYLRQILLAKRDYKCEGCGLDTWRGQLIALDVLYKNGDLKDTSDENLALMCPNCITHRHTVIRPRRHRRRRRSKNDPIGLDPREYRKSTFYDGSTCIWPLEKPSVESLVAAGFIYYPKKNKTDTVKCIYCKHKFIKWLPTDDPITEHHRLNPQCKFLEYT